MLNVVNEVSFKTLNSTQKLLKSNPEGEDLIVTADVQTDGETSKENQTWESQKGGLYLSLRLTRRYLMHNKKHFQANIGEAIAKALEEKCKVSVSFKEPNDFYIGSLKLGGALLSHSNLTVIYSIGINVNQQSFSQSLNKTATSLYLQTGKEHDVSDIRNIVLEEIDSKLRSYEETFPRYSKPLKTKKFKGKL